MLNYVEHFVGEAVCVFGLGGGPAYYYYCFSGVYIGIGDAFVGLTFEHEITGIFERNAGASQIPKMPSYLHGIL